MKNILILMALLLIAKSAHAMQEGMSEALADAKKDYIEFAKKDASDILSHEYADADATLLSRLDMGDMYNTSPESFGDVVDYRLQTVKDLAWAFQAAQLEALPKMIEESSKQLDNDKKAAARNIELVRLALQFKKSKINEVALREALNKDLFKN